MKAVEALLEGESGKALLVVGAPCVGKSTLARDALMAGLRRFGESGAIMTVSGRQIADVIGDQVIRELGATSQARPVTTLSAIAFRLITVMRSRSGEPLPRLLNGAEQDALLRSVCSVHVAHVRAGDPCGTCSLLREYFARDDWDGVLADAVAGNDGEGGDADSGVGVNAAFVMQLRDMLARMDELGVSEDREGTALSALRHWSPRVERLHVQWRLAFALRREYETAVSRMYSGEYRLDSSRLLVEGAKAVGMVGDDDLPRLLVVDDCQDLTFAGFTFLKALRGAGTRLLLVGNPDEAVQTFRGSYPEYLFDQIRRQLGADMVRLSAGGAGNGRVEERAVDHVDGYTYRDLVASRISLSIRSTQDETVPLPQRPGKLPQLPASLPIVALPQADPLPGDGSLKTALYRSADEETEDVVWRIKQAHILEGRNWNDMAVIAHDNATVRTIGERLRHDGVPVRYSSVTRPLKDEPFVQGLFALLELAMLRNQTVPALGMNLQQTALYVRSRVATVMGCPLVSVGGGRDHEGYPARLEPVDAAMNALASLGKIVTCEDICKGDASDDVPGGAADDAGKTGDAGIAGDTARMHALGRLMHGWEQWREWVVSGRDRKTITDDTIIDVKAPQGDELQFGVDAMYLLLEFADDAHAMHGGVAGLGGTGDVVDDAGSAVGAGTKGASGITADDVLAAVQEVCGRGDPHSRVFAHLWNLVGTVAQGLRQLPAKEPQYALSVAWNACDVASRWQREALNNTDAGRAANDRLDTAMRLFDYASGSAASRDLPEFFAQVRAMRIEADSLAKVAPIDEAVTLTTPAGSAGRHWPLVWIPAIQQGIWPNLAARNTMFGGEDLADVMLYGGLSDDSGEHGDNKLESVLYAEQKSLLVALTRASEQVTASAVYNDDLTPSDFLYGYMPERFNRERHASAEGREYSQVGEAGRLQGLDADPRGLVAAARVALAVYPRGSKESQDAVDALRLLASNGVEAADITRWPFLDEVEDASSGSRTVGSRAAAPEPDKAAEGTGQSSVPRIATLSPSAVDSIWGCPVCWMMENRFTGPRAGSVATSFGSLIHAVAETASNEGLDAADWRDDLPIPERVSTVRDRMIAIYEELRDDPTANTNPADQYNATRKDNTAHDVLGHIASYFVMSNTDEYPVNNVKNFRIGILESAQCERSFIAVFGLDDILAAYNAMDGVDPIGRDELAAIMGSLVGGWPEAMNDRLTVRLSGRIDRMETRIMPDGKRHVRLIDYKTGKVPSTKAIFNDLQLVCYQLGLAFPENGPRGAEALQVMPDIAQSGLFHVAQKDAPATSGTSNAQEGMYQPALFADGSLNTSSFMPRNRYKTLDKLSDAPDLIEEPPTGVSAAAWRQFLSMRGTQAVWSLSMIARVFYAAAASRSTHIQARPKPDHLQYCRMKAACPACAGEINTVFETRQS